MYKIKITAAFVFAVSSYISQKMAPFINQGKDTFLFSQD